MTSTIKKATINNTMITAAMMIVPNPALNGPELLGSPVIVSVGDSVDNTTMQSPLEGPVQPLKQDESHNSQFPFLKST